MDNGATFATGWGIGYETGTRRTIVYATVFVLDMLEVPLGIIVYGAYICRFNYLCTQPRFEPFFFMGCCSIFSHLVLCALYTDEFVQPYPCY